MKGLEMEKQNLKEEEKKETSGIWVLIFLLLVLAGFLVMHSLAS